MLLTADDFSTKAWEKVVIETKLRTDSSCDACIAVANQRLVAGENYKKKKLKKKESIFN